MHSSEIQWPKVPPKLTPKQLQAREDYMRLWHEELPSKYAAIEKFNHGYPASLPVAKGWKTLEIGAGLGEHAKYEDLTRQEYHFLEYRKEFCDEIKKRFPHLGVHCADIHQRIPFEDHSLDRVVAVHVLEHLVNLPVALKEIDRVLKPEGVLDIVIPCEGGVAHTLGRKVSAERLFKKNFKMDFTPIHKNEHVNTFEEIMAVLDDSFKIETSSFFPTKIPYFHLNFCAGFRLVKRLFS